MSVEGQISDSRLEVFPFIVDVVPLSEEEKKELEEQEVNQRIE